MLQRSNIGNARLAGFEKDLKLKGFDFNTVLSIFCTLTYYNAALLATSPSDI